MFVKLMLLQDIDEIGFNFKLQDYVLTIKQEVVSLGGDKAPWHPQTIWQQKV